MTESTPRIDSEWIALNAFRGLTKIASKGDMVKSTYDNALDLGGSLYPELLGPDVSLLRRERESDTTKEYRQKAELLSIRNNKRVAPLDLLNFDIGELKDLLKIAERNRSKKSEVDQLKKRLNQLLNSEQELSSILHSENKLIFRDAYNVERNLPSLKTGRGHRDFRLPDERVLRVRVLHPDKPEHVSGADIIYERHDTYEQKASIVAVQYKLWEDKVLYLTDPRLDKQIKRLHKFICSNGLCNHGENENTYRFPCCAAFLRPTDKLQKTDQKFFSSGEHLPICRIDDCKGKGTHGAEVLKYKDMKEISLSSETFEYLFNKGKIGSRLISYEELEKLYSDHSIVSAEDNVVIYAQEF